MILHGTDMQIGSRTFTMPAMSIGAFVKTKADRALLAKEGIEQEDQALAICRVMHVVLQRNYPDLKLDEIADEVTIGNMIGVWKEACAAWASNGDEGKAQAGSHQT